MEFLIEKYKNIRKKALISSKYNNKYAFIGIGNHSLNNLYPILNYNNVDVKYIVTKSQQNADLVSKNFNNIQGTTDIEKVLEDNEINGVFVCSSPSTHYYIAQKVISANKNIFIEKPPCGNLDELKELITLEKHFGIKSVVGLQKRYAPIYNKIQSKLKDVNYYSLKYQTGAYPEGDALLDLFIHPIDIAIYLFGEAELVSIQTAKSTDSSYTYLIHLKHKKDNIIGSMELSTDFSWTGANEQITINTKTGILHSSDTGLLKFQSKPKVIAGVPVEKIITPSLTETQLYNQNNFIPIKNHNQLYSAGFFNEIETFLKLCENKKAENKSNFSSLLNTYKLIEQIKTKI